MTVLAEPAQAARIAEVRGEAGTAEVSDSDNFNLSEQSTVTIGYTVTDRGSNCSVQVRLYREQNGRWLVVNTVLDADASIRGSVNLTLPRGEYRIQVIAVEASYHVTVDR